MRSTRKNIILAIKSALGVILDIDSDYLVYEVAKRNKANTSCKILLPKVLKESSKW